MSEKLEQQIQELTRAVVTGFGDMQNQMDTRFDAVDSRFDAVDSRFDAVEHDIKELRTEAGELRNAMDSVAEAVDTQKTESAFHYKQTARNERWIHELAHATDTKLSEA